MKRIVYSLFSLSLIFSADLSAQGIFKSSEAFVREGNEAYEAEKYDEAGAQYSQAVIRNPENVKGLYNMGDVLYQKGQFQVAAQAFMKAAEGSEAKGEKAQAFHNLGNALLAWGEKSEKEGQGGGMQPSPQATGQSEEEQPPTPMELFKQSVEAYKSALRLNPSDPDSKYNLSYAMRKLQQQQQKQENQDQNQDQDKKDQQDQKDEQEKQDQQDQQDQKQDQQDQQQQDKQNQQDQQNQEQNQQKPQNAQNQPQALTREEAERILEMLKNNEEQIQDKLQKRKARVKKVKVDKDW